MADPTPVCFALFAYALAVYGVRFVAVDALSLHGPSSSALNFALLVAGIGQAVCGVLALVRGIAYAGWVTTIFGVWLIGFHLLLVGHDEAALTDRGIVDDGLSEQAAAALAATNQTAWHANSVAWYVLVLLIPVLILAVPAFQHRNVPFMIGFTAIVALLVLLGWAFLTVYSTLTDVTRGVTSTPDVGSAVTMLRISAWCAFIGSASVFYVFARHVITPHEEPAERSEAVAA